MCRSTSPVLIGVLVQYQMRRTATAAVSATSRAVRDLTRETGAGGAAARVSATRDPARDGNPSDSPTLETQADAERLGGGVVVRVGQQEHHAPVVLRG